MHWLKRDPRFREKYKEMLPAEDDKADQKPSPVSSFYSKVGKALRPKEEDW